MMMRPNITIDLGSLADWISGIGSLAAVVVALAGFAVVERQRQRDRRDTEKGVAYEAVATLRDIGNNVKIIDKHMREQRNDISVLAGSNKIAIFKTVNPLIGLSNEGDATLPSGFTELMVKAQEVDLWNDALLLVDHNRALTTIMKEYREVWALALSKMPSPSSFTGQVGHMEASAAEFSAARVELIKLDGIVEALAPQIQEAVLLVEAVSERIGPVMKTYFKEPFLHLRGKIE